MVSESVEEVVVRLPSKESSRKNILRIIWSELTSGIGIWGSLKPLVAVIASIIPFLFLGQHFNREHRKATDWTMLQIPLILTVIFWVGLWGWSVFDAWYVATDQVRLAHNERRA